MFPSDIVVCYSEILVRILNNNIVSISNDFLLMSGEYSFNKMYENRGFILDRGLQFIIKLYGDICKKLNALAFELFDYFEPDKHYTSDAFKILNRYYL